MLSIWLSSMEDEMTQLNLNYKLKRIKNTTVTWSDMPLTMFGKIELFKHRRMNWGAAGAATLLTIKFGGQGYLFTPLQLFAIELNSNF